MTTATPMDPQQRPTPAAPAAPQNAASAQRVPVLEAALPGLWAGFLPAVPREDDRHLASQARRALTAAGLPHPAPAPLLLRQQHTADIFSLAGSNGHPPRPPGQDSTQPGPGANPFDGAESTLDVGGWLAVKTADCVPLLAVHPQGQAYAALHAGWRGTALGILPALLHRWRDQDGALADVRLAFGPHIRACCFQVRDDCLAHFDPAHLDGAVSPDPTLPPGQAYRLSLAQVLRTQATALGITPGQIVDEGHCTVCHRDAGQPTGAAPYASHRRALREGIPLQATNLAVIGRRD